MCPHCIATGIMLGAGAPAAFLSFVSIRDFIRAARHRVRVILPALERLGK